MTSALFLLDLIAQPIYTDESALLAGMATPEHGDPPTSGEKQWNASEWFGRMAQLGLEPQRHPLHPRPGCSCASTSAVVRAQRGDGKEALLLAVQLSDSAEGSASDSRALALVLRLAARLRHEAWLAKDVQLLLHPCCACAAARAPACSSAPLRRHLAAQTLRAAVGRRRDGAALLAALDESRGGLLRAAVSVALPAAGGAVRVDVAGEDGRLPNLDAYAAVWKVARSAAVRVPLVLRSDEGSPRTAAWRWLPPRASRAAALARRFLHFALQLALGAPQGPHAEALAVDVDAISLREVRPSGRGSELSGEQLLGLLEGSVRAFSNLEEALHHSHYWYVLLQPDAFVPLKWAAPLFLALPLASLGLRAAAHRSAHRGRLAARATEEPTLADESLREAGRALAAALAATAAHAICAGLLWLWRRPPHHTAPHAAPPAEALGLVLSYQALWLLTVGLLVHAMRPQRDRPFAVAACCSAAFGAVVFTCFNIGLGLVGASALAISALVVLPVIHEPKSRCARFGVAVARIGAFACTTPAVRVFINRCILASCGWAFLPIERGAHVPNTHARIEMDEFLQRWT
ncbi:hypothetical protein AB1Y20_007976 [Prymnesium parvum]|uniref:Uncharacterized protein n=1 Tax=Prymnesium parvum TaxID=97485 RepID=A0AB34ISE0_PRYPA